MVPLNLFLTKVVLLFRVFKLFDDEKLHLDDIDVQVHPMGDLDDFSVSIIHSRDYSIF